MSEHQGPPPAPTLTRGPAVVLLADQTLSNLHASDSRETSYRDPKSPTHRSSSLHLGK